MLVVRGFVAGLISAALLALLLLVPAGLVPGGTWVWPRAIWLVAVMGAVTVVGLVALAIARPASLMVRMQGMIAKKEKGQPLADAVISGMLGVYRLAWLVFIPIDVFYLHLLPRPSALISALGGVAGIAGTVMVLVVLAQNEFAAPNVQDQTQSHQRVIDTGLYGVIRHPFYAGALLMIAGIALWLESYAALIGVGGLIVLLIPRIAIEESFLRKNLPGYADYARRVRSRLVPYLI